MIEPENDELKITGKHPFSYINIYKLPTPRIPTYVVRAPDVYLNTFHFQTKHLPLFYG